MRNKPDTCRRNDGVALVIVLGLLSILTILAVAFASAMWVERLAAWNHANSVRAEALIQAALVRAMTDVNTSTAGSCYPCWTNRPAKRADAMGSDAVGVQLTDLLTGEAARTIPASLSNDVEAVANKCYWTNVVVNGKTNGRIAYIVANASGLVDVNLAGGRFRNWSTNINEIDPGNLLQDTLVAFTNQRFKDVRYETITEAVALNTKIKNPNQGFFTYSFDPARDQYFPMMNATDIAAIKTLGQAGAVLSDKFYINAITNYAGWTNSSDYYAFANDDGPTGFMVRYYWPLVSILSMPRAGGGTMVERPEDVAWNIVNYLDPDMIPSVHKGRKPWQSTEGSEALPLINEIVLKPSTVTSATYPSNCYEFAVELWFPFAPTTVVPADKFFLWVGVFTDPVASGAADDFAITNSSFASTNCTFSSNILNMAYGGTDFLVYTSPADKKISFQVQVAITNPPGFTNIYLPIGCATYVDGGVTNTVTNGVWFLARVYKQGSMGGAAKDIIVDEAMGYDNTGSEPLAGDTKDRQLKCFTNTMGYSVADPRSNGRTKYWRASVVPTGYTGPAPAGFIGGTSYFWNASAQTLGTTNVNCDAWSRKGSGLPIYFTNGPMENIGELGYIYRGNLDDEQPEGYKWWRTINLMHFDEGAALLDWCTVRPTNAPSHGLFCINSRQTDAVTALLNLMKIGYVSGPETNFVQLGTLDYGPLVSAIIANGPYLNFRSMFTSADTDDGGGGPVAAAFRAAVTNNHPEARGDIFKEDPFRRICELITFRQNIFIIAMAAQVFGGDGHTVVGEKRASAVVYRDSYTGRYFIRSFKWLTD